MRLTSFATLLCVTVLLVGCSESGNTNVAKNAKADEIAAYEEAVRKASAEPPKMMTSQESEQMVKEAQKNASSGT